MYTIRNLGDKKSILKSHLGRCLVIKEKDFVHTHTLVTSMQISAGF